MPPHYQWRPPRLSVITQGTQTAAFTLAAIPANPEIFQRSDGLAAAINQDGTINSAQNPALPGTVVAIWATGVGSPPFNFWDGGQISPVAAAFDCCRMVASSSANIAYSGAAPGIVAGVSR